MTYNNIKKAALKLFSQKGFYGTTIKEIASECDLKPSSVYSHITSKEELFMTIFYECIENILHSVQDLNKKVADNILTDPKEILYLYYMRIIKHFSTCSSEYLYLKQATFFMRDGASKNPINPHNFLISSEHIDHFRPFFMELQEKDLIIQENYLELFYSYMGVMIAYLEEQLIYDINVTEERVNKFWNIFWNGISK